MESQKRAENLRLSFLIKLVQNSVRHCAVARNWRQNNLRNCCFACVKNVKKTTTRQNILKILPKAYEEKGCATINLPKFVCVDNSN